MMAMGSYAILESQPDEDLVRRCRSGEEDAFSQLYHRYRKPVLCTAYRITRNVEDAQEAAQEIFLKVYRSLPEWNPNRSKLSTWLYRLAANHAIDRWRAQQRRLRWEASGPAESQDYRNSAADPRNEPLGVLERNEMANEIRRCSRRLPRLQRRLFILRHFYGMGLEEIARIEGRSLGTVKGLLFRAAGTMRRMLTRRIRKPDSVPPGRFIPG
jgi:RNA polymerase sigma-70 factor, ECF subfamily